MAVTNKGLMTASGSAEATDRSGVQRTFSRTYLLESDNIVTDDENAVLAAVGIGMYSRHPSYSLSWVVGIKVDLQETIYRGPAGPNGALWHATVDYGWLEHELRGGDGNPLDVPIKWDYRYEEEEDVLYEDVHGDPSTVPPTPANPILNAAYDYFDPPITVARQRGVLTVYQNVGSIDVPALDRLGNTINAAAWNTFPAKTVLLQPVEIPQREYDEATDTVFWPMVFRFKIRNPETWTRYVLNQGYRELFTSGSSTLQRNIYVDGVPATSPVLLSSSGHALSYPVAPADVVYLAFDIYKTSNFSTLGLDTIPNFPTS